MSRVKTQDGTKTSAHSSCWLSVAVLLIGCSQPAGPTLTPSETLAKARAGELTLIDIRTPMEWRQTGVAPLARRIDMHDPKGPAGFAEKVLAAVQGDQVGPDRPHLPHWQPQRRHAAGTDGARLYQNL